ncbi:PAAR domain-containing protein [Burkholderia sp. BCC1977]|uniref:PAAR domain-containing protein n=1 Tax=Burkholderia sp. BCC1977 TaxID=2817440 RepID=UPI002ABDEC53|nr:PAAR domain-containing protein [Burkholderia sp. BCC1977]
MKRRIAVVGDGLSSGGTVTPYDGPPFLVHGYQAALIGGNAFCTACQSVGAIAKAGGPYRIKFHGEVALDSDVVLCGCATPPHIVALLAGEAWCNDRIKDLGEVVSSRTLAGGIASIRKGIFDERVRATKEVTEGLPYYIETSDGRMHFGRLDSSGKLPRIDTGDEASDYTVYWGDDALSKQYGE